MYYGYSLEINKNQYDGSRRKSNKSKESVEIYKIIRFVSFSLDNGNRCVRM